MHLVLQNTLCLIKEIRKLHLCNNIMNKSNFHDWFKDLIPIGQAFVLAKFDEIICIGK